jgi:type VI secretion system protein ImpB
LDEDQKSGAVPPPKRRLRYDVYGAKGTQQRELLFSIGILANFHGHRPTEPHRRFVTVNRSNFDTVLSALAPELRLKVAATLVRDDSKLNCELKFRSLADFSPDGVANQIPVLRRLLELRNNLAALRAKLSNNDKLQERLSDLLNRPEMLQQVKDQEGL